MLQFHAENSPDNLASGVTGQVNLQLSIVVLQMGRRKAQGGLDGVRDVAA
jgi:hypothetical protein